MSVETVKAVLRTNIIFSRTRQVLFVPKPNPAMSRVLSQQDIENVTSQVSLYPWFAKMYIADM